MILGKKAGARYVWRLPKSALRKLSLCLLAIPLSSCWLGEQLYLSQFRDECKTIVRENESAFEKLSALSADLPYANVRPYGFHEDPDPDLIDLSVSFLNEREIKELYETGKRDFLFQDTRNCEWTYPEGRSGYLACLHKSPPIFISLSFGNVELLNTAGEDSGIARVFVPGQTLTSEDREWLASNFSERLGLSIEQLLTYAEAPFQISIADRSMIPYWRYTTQETINELMFAARIKHTVEMLDGSGRTFEFQKIVVNRKSVCSDKFDRLIDLPKRAYLEKSYLPEKGKER